MTKSFLAAHAVAEVCYLYEALLWLALYRFPEAASSQYDEDGRNDDEWVEGIAINFEIDTITKEECGFNNLPINPVWKAEQTFYHHISPEVLKKWVDRESNAERRASRQIELSEAIAFEKEANEWKKSFKAHLDLFSAKLFVALKEGSVSATGKSLLEKLLVRLEADEQRRELRKLDLIARAADKTRYAKAPIWSSVDRETIPKDFWVSTKINWEYSCARGNDTAYALILVNVSELLEAFPHPKQRNLRRVSQVGDSFVLLDDQGEIQNLTVHSRGRPSFKWDEFSVEMAKRVRDGALPGKQEALISDMQVWCHNNWGREVARSTLLEKIKPYYDAFIRKSESD